MQRHKIRQQRIYCDLQAETTGESVPARMKKQKSSEDGNTDEDKNKRQHQYNKHKVERFNDVEVLYKSHTSVFYLF